MNGVNDFFKFKFIQSNLAKEEEEKFVLLGRTPLIIYIEIKDPQLILSNKTKAINSTLILESFKIPFSHKHASYCAPRSFEINLDFPFRRCCLNKII